MAEWPLKGYASYNRFTALLAQLYPEQSSRPTSQQCDRATNASTQRPCLVDTCFPVRAAHQDLACAALAVPPGALLRKSQHQQRPSTTGKVNRQHGKKLSLQVPP